MHPAAICPDIKWLVGNVHKELVLISVPWPKSQLENNGMQKSSIIKKCRVTYAIRWKFILLYCCWVLLTLSRWHSYLLVFRNWYNKILWSSHYILKLVWMHDNFCAIYSIHKCDNAQVSICKHCHTQMISYYCQHWGPNFLQHKVFC